MNVLEVILRLLDPTPLTDEEMDDHLAWADNDSGFINVHHPLHVGLSLPAPDNASQAIRDAMDVPLILRTKHEYLHTRCHTPHQQVFLFERPYRAWATYLLVRHGAYRFDQAALAKLIIDVWVDAEGPHGSPAWTELLRGFPLGLQLGCEDILDPSGSTLVYRGIAVPDPDDIDERAGYAWTTDRKRAQWFARRFLTDDEVAVVITGRVNNDHVLFCSNDRGETEVVSGAVEVLETHELETT